MADNLQYSNLSCKFTATYSGAIMHSFEPVAHSDSHSPLSYYNPAIALTAFWWCVIWIVHSMKCKDAS